jgi:murein DD-endopeptidase MepM/ murein hydrolase activator NlpD
MTTRWLTLIAGLVLITGVAAQSKAPTTLKKKLGSIKNEKSKVQLELSKTIRTARVVRTDLKTLETRLDTLGKQIEETQSNLYLNRVEQKKLAANLAELEELMAQTREQVRRRLKAMYMQTDGTYLSLLAGATTVGDFASRASMLSTIAEKDRELFDRYVSLTDRIRDRKGRQDQVVKQYERLRAFEQRKEQELSETKEEKDEALRDLQKKQAELKRLLARYEADERAIAAEIAAYNRRIRNNPKAAVTPFKGRFIRPVSAPVTSGYGSRLHPILKIRRLHAGSDFGARSGSPIVAVADGVVISAGYSGGYGNRVILDHGGGITTVYAHCRSLSVSSGQRVRQGQRIAAVGSTGLSTAPHLHFEFRIDGRPVNPMSRIR